eukprot:3240531-Rhodomonas_salina.1
MPLHTQTTHTHSSPSPDFNLPSARQHPHPTPPHPILRASCHVSTFSRARDAHVWPCVRGAGQPL